MIYVLGGIAALLLLALAVGGLTRRIDLTSCCSIADPRHDARMRAAFEDAPPERTPADTEVSDARVLDGRAATTPSDG